MINEPVPATANPWNRPDRTASPALLRAALVPRGPEPHMSGPFSENLGAADRDSAAAAAILRSMPEKMSRWRG
jgi:hypothetical protein